MVEPKVSLNLLVPGAGRLSSQECEKNPKESYDEHKMLLKYTKGKGKYQKEVKKLLVVKTRKQRLVSQNINICEEAYHHMLHTPTSAKLSKPTKYNKYSEVIERVWDTLSVDERLRHHFDQIAFDLRAVSYSYEVLGD
jgi:hypothetical protein